MGCAVTPSDEADATNEAASAIVTGSTVGVKWHPGHYYQPMGGDPSVNGYVMKAAYQEMYATPAIAGLQVRFDWAELEKGKDDYDFSLIEGHLQKLSTTGNKDKRLIIFLQTKSYNTSTKLVPDYLTNPNNPGYETSYQGGIYPWGNNLNGSIASNHKGDGIKLWNNSVRDRMAKLMTALGNRFNAHSHFEGVILGETAMGQPLINVTPAMENAYYDAHLFFHDALRTAFPNTMTIQFANYPRNKLDSLITSMRENGTSLGGPDIFVEDPGLNATGTKYTADGVYKYYPKLSGEVALAPSVMSTNYRRTSATGPSRKPSIGELLSFARNNLKANYIFWSRDPEFYNGVLSKLKSNDPSVQLLDACPKSFAPCITK